jgi:hypothetical protein
MVGYAIKFFVNYPEQFTDVQGGYREYPGRYPYSTSVNTFVGVAGVAVGTAACFVPAYPGKMVGNYKTYIACLMYRQKKKSSVVK